MHGHKHKKNLGKTLLGFAWLSNFRLIGQKEGKDAAFRWKKDEQCQQKRQREREMKKKLRKLLLEKKEKFLQLTVVSLLLLLSVMKQLFLYVSGAIYQVIVPGPKVVN